MATPSFHSLPLKDARNRPYDLSQHKNHPILIVNVASKCGFTPQYKSLETLHKNLGPRGLVILGFPCNQFGSQAPGSAEEETQVCQLNYGVTFPIMEKVDVNGENAHPVYQYLKEQKAGLLGLRRVKWNFEKFLVDGEGKVVGRYASTTSPESIEGDILKLLK
ncbi:glutathione peroxidase gpx1 [Gaertneriomyces sp. JEL0708]|nr:glutathione peroxidase gpx1 [Gaertneriomyces sp. JEL0708]